MIQVYLPPTQVQDSSKVIVNRSRISPQASGSEVAVGIFRGGFGSLKLNDSEVTVNNIGSGRAAGLSLESEAGLSTVIINNSNVNVTAKGTNAIGLDILHAASVDINNTKIYAKNTGFGAATGIFIDSSSSAFPLNTTNSTILIEGFNKATTNLFVDPNNNLNLFGFNKCFRNGFMVPCS